MAVQTPRLAQRRKAQAAGKKLGAPKQGSSKSKSGKASRQNAWQKLFDSVVKHKSFKVWLVEHETTREKFASQRHGFAELQAIQEWCNRHWLLQKLERLQADGKMLAYLREHGYKPGEILSLWSTERLQQAWDDLRFQPHGGGVYGAKRLGIADQEVGYRGKTRSHASKRAQRKPREANAPRNGQVHIDNRGKSIVDYREVAGNLPNPQGGPVQRGQAVAHAGLTSKQMGERKKRSPTRRKRLT